MNLADAIRQASGGNALSLFSLHSEIAETTPAPAAAPAPAKPVAKEAAPVAPAAAPQDNSAAFVEAVKTTATESAHNLRLETYEDEITVSSVETPTIAQQVKFELMLTPEQLSALFRGVVTAEHTVMTLPEAAKHLRIAGRELEEMAKLGQIPAFLINGKWRFSRNSVDEWLTQQSFRKEMEA
ncbi:MAG: hypothetical protein QOJ65_681 [Fimbriimonadaceae bacterium]|jgi:excisionase family DNA binding protein|nr:hypothetical protein [Fimbriimonadaceae bacterium]